MAYTKQTWQDLPNTTTPITAEKLNHIEDGIYDVSNTNATTSSAGLMSATDKTRLDELYTGKALIMVYLGANTTIATTAWTQVAIPFDKVKTNYGGKFSLNTSTGAVTYTGNKKLKATVQLFRGDATTSGTLYPSSTYIGWFEEYANGTQTLWARSVAMGDATTIVGKVASSSTGNSVLQGHANNMYTYMIVEEI